MNEGDADIPSFIKLNMTPNSKWQTKDSKPLKSSPDCVKGQMKQKLEFCNSKGKAH